MTRGEARLAESGSLLGGREGVGKALRTPAPRKMTATGLALHLQEVEKGR